MGDLDIATNHIRGSKITAKGEYKINCSCGWTPPAFTLITTRSQALKTHFNHVEETIDAANYENNTAVAQNYDDSGRRAGDHPH